MTGEQLFTRQFPDGPTWTALSDTARDGWNQIAAITDDFVEDDIDQHRHHPDPPDQEP